MSPSGCEQNEMITVDGYSIPVHRVHTLVIGSGAAALKAADRLHQFGIHDIAVMTESLTGGTSYNTGSDKQTYFRLSTGTKTQDSPYVMAEDLFKGGAMHGDIALVEAVGSTEAFQHLASIGVAFPKNRYGGYAGYKTDHDSRERGSSIGPYTSRRMVEVLLEEVRRRNITIFDRFEAVSLIQQDGRVCGAVAVDVRKLNEPGYGLTLFMADNVVLGTGGPGGIYRDSVYPAGHSGSIGLALEIGAEAYNLQESQFGLSSVKFRWNVSGSYQQVIPSYISTDADGGDERQFLQPFFPDTRTLCRAIFLKGYQWPFDAEKITSWGSSLIDILVYRERVILGRKVFLDYRKNPEPVQDSEPFSVEALPEEARTYLSRSQAEGILPFQRLLQMNPQAVELYRTYGIDLETEPLEIAVSAQHNNGGLAVDMWWESTNIRRLFPVGEIAGTHGVNRPGGSALNSGQVGATRAAEKIAGAYREYEQDWDGFASSAVQAAGRILRVIEHSLRTKHEQAEDIPGTNSLDEYRKEYRNRMSARASVLRSAARTGDGAEEAGKQTADFGRISIHTSYLIPKLLQTRHLVLTHYAYLSAISAYLSSEGGSRGSCLVLDHEGESIHPSLEPEWKYKPENRNLKNYILVTCLDGGQFQHSFMKCRSMPEEDFWFETVWRENREKSYFE